MREKEEKEATSDADSVSDQEFDAFIGWCTLPLLVLVFVAKKFLGACDCMSLIYVLQYRTCLLSACMIYLLCVDKYEHGMGVDKDDDLNFAG